MAAEPLLSDWQALYQVAQKLKETSPWQWLGDNDIVSVKDPVTGEIGYCSVIGNLGEAYGLIIYPGSEGLVSYFETIHAKGSDNFEVAVKQKCLSLIFANFNYHSRADTGNFPGAQGKPSLPLYLKRKKAPLRGGRFLTYLDDASLKVLFERR